ncbi:hypothetical protein [Paenirhodobacter populi]|nr:hypothetical protein [Sinirhodobacter populi]
MRRLIVELPEELIAEVDEWGAAAGETSRHEAVDALLRAGLKKMEAAS